MKIRYIVFSYVILLLGVMMMLYAVCMKEFPVSLDMVHYNEELKQVEEGLSNHVRKEDLEQEFKCEIIYLTDKDYGTRLNEAMQLQAVILDLEQGGNAVGKVIWMDAANLYEELRDNLLIKLEFVCGILLVAGLLLCLIVYVYFVAPFRRLQTFSGEIAKGNFDVPLPMQRYNFFGAFTESFDILREELKRAKESEYQANRSKKELMAELSHDIKTPLSTIKATCEVLQLKAQDTDTIEKINIIAAKAEVMDALVENLFQTTMEELEVLKVEPVAQSSLDIKTILDELKFYGNIRVENDVPECLVYMDKLRLSQVIDNVVSNSRKYAGTEISVSFFEEKEGIRIQLRDYGQGISEEELVCVTEKYYRGSNAKGKTGSGLGLYLSHMFMEGMYGGMECCNASDRNGTGFLVVLYLKKV